MRFQRRRRRRQQRLSEFRVPRVPENLWIWARPLAECGVSLAPPHVLPLFPSRRTHRPSFVAHCMWVSALEIRNSAGGKRAAELLNHYGRGDITAAQ